MKFVLLWTDLALWLMAAAVVGYALRIRRHAQLRATWQRVLRDPVRRKIFNWGMALLLVASMLPVLWL